MLFQSTRDRRHQGFKYTSLEAKRLLAGDVRVFENVNLYLRGDNLDNQIEVVVEGDELRINGLDGTTINGQASFVVQGTTVTEAGVTFAGGLRGHFGPGHDNVEIRDAIFESNSIIYGGTGDDNIELVDGQFLGSTVIQTFDGNDSISTSGTYFDGDFYAITLDGQDSVTSVNTSFNGTSIVATGEHSDTIHSEHNHYTGDVNLILSLNGADEVQLINPVVGGTQLGVFLGNHNDTVGIDLTNAEVDGTIRIGGQAGIDQTSGMSMGDVADSTQVFGVEKGVLVFESALGGRENVTAAATSYTAVYDSGVDDGDDSTDTYGEQYATAVILETTQTIHQVEWSGVYNRNIGAREGLPELEDNFVIEIFEGTVDPNDVDPYRPLPPVDAASIASFEVGSANRVDAGELTFEIGGEIKVAPRYEYFADIQFTMEAGKRYWVSIYADQLDGDQAAFGNTWGWGSGSELSSETLFTIGVAGQNESMWSSTKSEGPYFLQNANTDIAMDLRLRS